MAGLVIFDGDDTLWVTEPLYDVARSAAGAVVAAAGYDAAAWDALQRTIDVANVARFGLSAQRFPTSCVEAVVALATELGRTVDDALRADVWNAADDVFSASAPLVEGAASVLAALRPRHRLALLTKGDEEVQRKRIADSGLAEWFDVVEIVPHKDADTFTAVATGLGAPPAVTWSIGNSLRSDVLPAVSAGMRAVWIDAHVWEYERAHPETEVPAGAVVAQRLADVPGIVSAGSD